MLTSYITNVKNGNAITHCITNYVTVNDVANVILACGGSPIMADGIEEVADIQAICQSLVINMGTLNSVTVEAMIAAGQAANKHGHPVIFDPVGVGASPYRNECAARIINEMQCDVIRGNVSEIKSVYQGEGKTAGVDVAAEDMINADNLEGAIEMAKALATRTGAVILITGAIDIITDGTTTYTVANGDPMMANITGAGCMLNGVVATYCGVNPTNLVEATLAACVTFSVAGEYAAKRMVELQTGNSSYRNYLIDYVFTLIPQEISTAAKYELLNP